MRMSERPMPQEIIGAVPPEARGSEAGEEHETAKTIRRVFEYRDANGEPIGVAEVLLDDDPVEMPYASAKDGKAVEGRKVMSFVVRGKKEGKPAEIDMLALANPHGVDVVAADERLANYAYLDDKKRAVVPPLETPLDVGVFLHELGHADQFHEDRFKEIVPLYGKSRQAVTPGTELSYGSVRNLLASIIDAVPEAAVALDDENIEQLDTLESRRHAALDHKAQYERDLDEQERLRDGELQTFVENGLRGALDVEDFLRRCDAAAAEEGEPTSPPLVPSAGTMTLVDELEKAGFVFAAEGEKDESGLVQRSAFRDAAAVAAFVREALGDMRAAGTALSYDEESGRLGVTMDIRDTGLVRIDGLSVRPDDFESYTRLRTGADALVGELEKRSDAAYDDAMDYARAQQVLMDHFDLNAVAAIPTKMMERDATRRALQWLREVRSKTGADLFKTHTVPPEALVSMGARRFAQDGCVGSTADGMGGGPEEEVEASVLADLKRALATYAADKLRLRPPDDERDIGITPVAGLDRTKDRKPDKH